MASTLGEAVLYLLTDNSKLESGLSDAEKKTESASAGMAKALGGALVAGAAVAGSAILAIGSKAFDVASKIDSATDQIGASLGLSADKAKAYGQTIKDVYANNFGDSIEDVGKSIETVSKTLKLTAADPALKTMTENAFRLRDVFGTDVADSVDAVKTLMDQFGVTSEQAFDLLADGYQRGMDRSGDFLDTIGEYSTQFANGGASASDFFKFIETGMQGGVLGTDKAADAFKEFGIRIKDSSDLTKDSLGALGISYDALSQGFADGSETSIGALEDVLTKIFEIDDPIKRATIGVGLFGTQWEDLGESTMKSLSQIEEGFGVHEGAITSLDSKYTNLGSVAEGMWRQFEVGIAPAGEALLTLANDNLPAIQGVVDTVSAAIVAGVNLLPVAIAEAHKKWDEDWAGIRTTWENFASEMPQKQAEFWREWNTAFNTGSKENSDAWEGFFGGLFGGASRWAGTVFDLLTTFLKNWNNTTTAWHALTIGDWSTFWTNIGENFTNAFGVLLSAIDIFDEGFKSRVLGALQSAWDGLKSLWTDFSGWWSSAWGSLAGIVMPKIETPTGGGGNGGFGGSGFKLPDFNMPSLTPGDWPISASAAAGTTNHITVNTTGGYENGFAAGEGIVDAMRFRGH
jgi:hypothetical protein